LPQGEILGEGWSYNCEHGKGAEGKRMAEWPVVAEKSGNADGAKGPVQRG